MSDAEQQVVEVQPVNNAAFVEHMGKGRPKGVPNKNTVVARNLARQLAEERSDKFLECFDRVAEKRPERACNMYIELLKLLTPKTPAAFQIEAGNVSQDGGAVAMRVRGLFGSPE